MQLRNIHVLTRREYVSRIKTKGFWISTLLIPLFLIGISVIPSYVASKAEARQRLVLVDETGQLGGRLLERLQQQQQAGEAGRMSFDVTLAAPAADREAQRAELDRQVLDGEIDAWVWVGAGVLNGDDGRVEYHAESVSNLFTQRALEGALSAVARGIRLERAGVDPTLVDELSRGVDLTTIRVTAEGGTAQSGSAGFLLAYILFFLLYMTILIYGTQVLNGVLEEKSSRVVELVLASVEPFELMFSKLVGICLVGLTQLTLWIGTIIVLTSPAVGLELDVLPGGMPQLSPVVGVHFLLHFLLGFFVYATFYAALGAAFNNVQEAQQLSSLAVIFLISPMMLMMVVINDPDSTLSVVSSLIPIFTPLLMLLRIAVKMPPLWQIALGYLLTAGFGLFMVSLAARIYRTGILMYGKKPTVRELLRWVRHA